VIATLLQLGPVAGERSAQAIVAGLGLADGGVEGRPRVAAAMIASADGRATVSGMSVAHGHPAGRALLRELRTGVDAILVGTETLRAEGYAHLLDDDLLLTLAPLFAAGDGATALEGAPLDPPRRLRLSDRHRAGDDLFLHYAATT
jgi:riboflavin biosynthesis pyrimidine reductase